MHDPLLWMSSLYFLITVIKEPCGETTHIFSYGLVFIIATFQSPFHTYCSFQEWGFCVGYELMIKGSRPELAKQNPFVMIVFFNLQACYKVNTVA